MALITKTRNLEYWTAGRINNLLGISYPWLLKIVAIGRVRLHVAEGYNPRYCITDVQKYAKENRVDDRPQNTATKARHASRTIPRAGAAR
jgi:hypothetical protein